MFRKLMSLAPFAALAVIACGSSHSGVRSNKASLADTYKTPVILHEGAVANDRPPLVLTEEAPASLSRANHSVRLRGA